MQCSCTRKGHVHPKEFDLPAWHQHGWGITLTEVILNNLHKICLSIVSTHKQNLCFARCLCKYPFYGCLLYYKTQNFWQLNPNKTVHFRSTQPFMAFLPGNTSLPTLLSLHTHRGNSREILRHSSKFLKWRLQCLDSRRKNGCFDSFYACNFLASLWTEAASFGCLSVSLVPL